jgi:hypothetical protein
METSPEKKDPLPDLAGPPRPRTVADYLILAAWGAIALVVLPLLLLIGLEYGNPRYVGPPHWSHKYFRAAATAWWVAVLALFIFMMLRDLWPK